MDVRKLAMMMGVAASCAGCVTETTTMQMPAEAAGKFKVVKEAEPTPRDAKPQTWIAFGQVQEGKGDDPKIGQAQRTAFHEESRKAYQKAIEVDGKCVAGHIQLANLYVKQDDHERAIGVYQRALQQNPKSAALWHQQGMLYCTRKDLKTGAQCLAKAHELQPDDRTFAKDYGLCLALAGQAPEAVIVLAKVMNKAEANYNVARMMVHINQPDLSRQYIQAALIERPTHQGSLSLLAQFETPRGSNPATLVGAPIDSSVQRATLKAPQ